MDKYEHITKMETIMNRQSETLQELNRLLDALEAQQQDYQELLRYYCSEQRWQDLDDDARHLIPETMPRGVLSEDGVDDLLCDRRETIIRMLETAVQMLKE